MDNFQIYSYLESKKSNDTSGFMCVVLSNLTIESTSGMIQQ